MANVILRRWGPGKPRHDDAVVIGIADRTITRGANRISLPRLDHRIAMMLLAFPGRITSRDEIIDGLYSDAINGGPLVPQSVIATRLVTIRRRLAPFGVKIITRWYRGLEVVIDPLPTASLAMAA